MFSFSEEGVSPVVGVLLLVCLTVVMVGICGVMFAGLMPSETDARYVEEMERKFFWGAVQDSPLHVTVENARKIRLTYMGSEAIPCEGYFLKLYVNGEEKKLYLKSLNGLENSAVKMKGSGTVGRLERGHEIILTLKMVEIGDGDVVRLAIVEAGTDTEVMSSETRCHVERG